MTQTVTQAAPEQPRERTREEIPEHFTWKLSDIYPNWEAWEAALKEFEAKLAGYLSKLTQDEIFDRNRAERYLLLARDIPGYNVQLTLKPAGTGPGGGIEGPNGTMLNASNAVATPTPGARK